MDSINSGQWSRELANEHYAQLIQEAAHWRLIQSLRPAAKRAWLRLQPLALLRSWRVVAPRLQWAGPADETPCN